ncbi:hypothetical protein O3P69_013650 [Scylla paramamosain]|uniref:Uncharacterized protein n=1 Tax=Scylla paramamosain TaxID=85552 RepID=A0AAW0SQV4_SCYPA
MLLFSEHVKIDNAGGVHKHTDKPHGDGFQCSNHWFQCWELARVCYLFRHGTSGGTWRAVDELQLTEEMEEQS